MPESDGVVKYIITVSTVSCVDMLNRSLETVETVPEGKAITGGHRAKAAV